MKKRVLLFFGTRPEAIKMAPVALELASSKYFEVSIGLSGQHKDLVKPILDFFGLEADFDLGISKECQNIEDAIAVGLPKLCAKLRESQYDLILVHGDTSATLTGGLAGFYQKIPVGHVEAGLRSGSNLHPFPEEMNRKLTASLCTYNFAATKKSVINLLDEGHPESSIYKTGNTVVDALKMASQIINENEELKNKIEKKFEFLDSKKPWVLLTGHRRENLNDTMTEVVSKTVELAKSTGALILFPMHPNPKIKELVQKAGALGDVMNIMEPLNYQEMVWLYSKLSLIVTDSGGIQEEAASFGLPTMVTRLVTERSESIDAGLSTLVGHDLSLILLKGQRHLFAGESRVGEICRNPYGDGFACERIKEVLEWDLVESQRRQKKDFYIFRNEALSAV